MTKYHQAQCQQCGRLFGYAPAYHEGVPNLCSRCDLKSFQEEADKSWFSFREAWEKVTTKEERYLVAQAHIKELYTNEPLTEEEKRGVAKWDALRKARKEEHVG